MGCDAWCLNKRIIDTIRKYIPMFDITAKKRFEMIDFSFSDNDLNDLFHELIKFYVGLPYEYQLPSKTDPHGAYIGKETKYSYLIYKRIKNNFALPTYEDVRLTFVCPKNYNVEKIIRRIDMTISRFYKIKRTICKFMSKVYENICDDEEFREILRSLDKEDIEKAKKILYQKSHIKMGDEIIEIGQPVFESKWIQIYVSKKFINRLVFEHYIERHVIKGYEPSGDYVIDYCKLGKILEVVG